MTSPAPPAAAGTRSSPAHGRHAADAGPRPRSGHAAGKVRGWRRGSVPRPWAPTPRIPGGHLAALVRPTASGPVRELTVDLTGGGPLPAHRCSLSGTPRPDTQRAHAAPGRVQGLPGTRSGRGAAPLTRSPRVPPGGPRRPTESPQGARCSLLHQPAGGEAIRAGRSNDPLTWVTCAFLVRPLVFPGVPDGRRQTGHAEGTCGSVPCARPSGTLARSRPLAGSRTAVPEWPPQRPGSGPLGSLTCRLHGTAGSGR